MKRGTLLAFLPVLLAILIFVLLMLSLIVTAGCAHKSPPIAFAEVDGEVVALPGTSMCPSDKEVPERLVRRALSWWRGQGVRVGEYCRWPSVMVAIGSHLGHDGITSMGKHAPVILIEERFLRTATTDYDDIVAAVLAHEYGHALGLEHPDESDIMNHYVPPLRVATWQKRGHSTANTGEARK